MSGRVTALKAQQKNSQRVSVYLDDEFAFGLARIAAAWLWVGQELSDEKIAELQAHDAREVALQKALRLLESRPRAEAEIRKRLEKHAIPEPVIVEVLERLRSVGLVDDQLFAQAWVENRSEFRPRSRRALAVEMRQRGVGSDAIEEALQGIDEEALAYQAAQKKVRRFAELDWATFRQKMGAFLAQRGFNYEISRSVIQRVWNEIHLQDGHTDILDIE